MFDSSKRCVAGANSGAKSVTGTASVIAASLSSTNTRKCLVITNCDASATCYLGIGFTPTTADYSIKLAPGAVVFLDGTMPTEAISALSSSGTITVRVYEGTS